jgi:hypothetical protein
MCARRATPSVPRMKHLARCCAGAFRGAGTACADAHGRGMRTWSGPGSTRERVAGMIAAGWSGPEAGYDTSEIRLVIEERAQRER